MGRAKVDIQELDLSTRVPSFPGIYGGIVIPSKKGDVDEATLVTTETDLLKYFTPDETVKVGYSNAYYSAVSYLIKSNKLWVVRAANVPLYGGCYLTCDNPLPEGVTITASAASDLLTVATSTEQQVLDAATFFNVVSTAEKVILASTGTMPAGLTAGVTYYLIKVSSKDKTVRVATSAADAEAGTFIDFTTDGTGTIVLVPDGATANGSVEYSITTPASYVLSSDDGKITGLTSGFTVDVLRDAFNTSDNFYAMCATRDSIKLTAAVFPTVESGDALDALTTYYVIKITGFKEIQLARSSADASAGTYIPISTVGNTIVGTLQNKEDSSAVTADDLTDLLTPTALFFDACVDNDIVNFTTIGALPIGIGIAEVTEVDCLAASAIGNGDYFLLSSPSTDYYVWFNKDATPIDPATPVAEITSVTCVADVLDSLHGKYFLLNSTTVNYYVWFNTSGITGYGDPSLSGLTGVEVVISTGDTANTVGINAALAINALTAFSAPAPGASIFIITCAVAGIVVDATAGTSGFTVSVTTQGHGAVAGTGIEVGIATGDTDEIVANKLDAAIDAIVADFTSTASDSSSEATVTITNINLGICDAPTDGLYSLNTGFTFTVDTTGRGVGTNYYVIKSTTPDIQVALTSGGTAIDITSAGTGTHTITLKSKLESSTLVGDLSNDILTISATLYSWIFDKDKVQVSSAGTLPSGLAVLTNYYVIKTSTENQIKLASSTANVDLEISVDILDAGIGVHTIANLQNQELYGLEQKCLLFYGANQGEWTDDIYVTTLHYPYGDSDSWTSDEQDAADTVKEENSFLVYIWKANADGTVSQVENTYTCSRDPDKKDGYGNNIYVETILEQSNYIRAIDNEAIYKTVLPTDQTIILKLDKGDDGNTVSDTHMLTALDALANRRNIFVTLLLDGDWTTPSYQKQGLLSLAETRKDCFALLGCPISDERASGYMTEILTYRKTELNANSSYGALFTSHLKITDKYNDRDIYVGCDGYVGAAISETAANYEIWYPPAGPRRGVLKVLDVVKRFTEGEMDVLYDNNINPIDYYPGKGIRIWGQKTLLSRPSALDRINVRLLLIVIEPGIAEFLEDFLFEFNDALTRALITSGITSYMQNIKSRRGVYAFSVVCDESNNTPEIIDANKMEVWLYVQPTKSAEFITFKTIITRTGASFSLV